jgi:hypothetical protein
MTHDAEEHDQAPRCARGADRRLRLKENTFYATIHLHAARGGQIVVDARPPPDRAGAAHLVAHLRGGFIRAPAA